MPLRIPSSQSYKKKPPPRPPPPNLNKLKSKSTHTIHKNCDNLNLIDWSPPNSPRSDTLPKFGGSVSSSFSSSTSSIASIKKSIEYDGFLATNFSSTVWGTNSAQNSNNTSPSMRPITRNNNYGSNNMRNSDNNPTSVPSSSLFGPTIIRPSHKIKPRPELPSLSHSSTSLLMSTGQPPSPPSLPMPTGPPPSPPKDASNVITPYGIALYQFPATQPGDLGLEVDDVVILIRRVNKEWLHGQVNDQEGIFPENFIQIINPLPEDLR